MRVLVVSDPNGSENILSAPTADVSAIFVTGNIGKSDKILQWKSQYGKIFPKMVARPELEAGFREYARSAHKILTHLASKAPTYYVLGNNDVTDAEAEELSERYLVNIPKLWKSLSGTRNLFNLHMKSAQCGKIRVAGVSNFLESWWIKTFAPDNIDYLEKASEEEPAVKKFLSSVGSLDILLTHKPPYTILDEIPGSQAETHHGKHGGSNAILELVRQDKPRFVFCGHFPSNRGKVQLGATAVVNSGGNGEYFILDV